MKEQHIRVSRTARYYTLGSAPSPSELWLVCHGYRQLARRFLPRFTGLDDGARLIVAPEGSSRFYLHDPAAGRHGKEVPVGASWMTREDRENEIADYVRFLDAVVSEVAEAIGASPRLTVFGFSQGAQTVCRWVAASNATVERIILWGGYPPHDLDLERGIGRMKSAEVILVRGLEDEFFSADVHSSQEARIREWGIPFETLTHTGSHELDPDLLLEIAERAG